MSSPTALPNTTPPEPRGLRRNSVTVSGILFLVLAAASPIIGLTGAVPVTYVIGNGVGVSLAYIVIGSVLLLFAVGFVLMSRHVTDAGALYAYVGKGLGRKAAYGTAGLAIYAYTAIQVAIYGFFGATITALVDPVLGANIPWWIATLALIAVVQLFGYLHLELGAKVLGVLLLGEWGTMLAMAISVAAHSGAGQGFAIAQVFSTNAFLNGAPGVALMFAFASSLGFEAAAVFGEEVKDPRKSVPRATNISITLIALFFTLTTWMVTVGYGPSNVVAAARKALQSGNTAQLIYTLGDRYLGPWAPVAMSVFVVTSIFACALAFHNGIARYLFTLGRSGTLPNLLGRTHRRTHAPILASLSQTVGAALIVMVFAILRVDPINVVFNWGGGIAVISLVLAYMLVSASVTVYFRRNVHADANLWNSLIAPVLSIIAMGGTLVEIILNFTTLIGGTPPACRRSYRIRGRRLHRRGHASNIFETTICADRINNIQFIDRQGPRMTMVSTPAAEIHPLAPLTEDEIWAFRDLLTAHDLVSSDTRFAYVTLREPEKAVVMAYTAGAFVERSVSALLVALGTGETREVVANLTTRELVTNRKLDAAIDGQGPTFDGDFDLADEIVKADSEWLAAIAKRGVTDIDNVRTVALSAGSFGAADEIGVRAARVLSFYSNYPSDSIWAHPIDGVVAHIDLTNRRVLRVVETDIEHIPTESGDYLAPEVRGSERTTLKPLRISQPEGVSFTLVNNVLSWQNWEVRLGFNGREGLTLHQLSFVDGGQKRSIIYRASISEMVVPYGDPTPTHDWQNYFDVGEYQFGRLANSLELGCDCVGEITYLDAMTVSDDGEPRRIRNAICVHEEDYGILWKHNDMFAGTSETRRQRRIVISFFVTVGNYDYGFYWYLYLDGTIQLEAKATGIVFTSGHPGGDYAYASELAPGLGAPFHQHLFSARLDMAVDGESNAVEEIDAESVPMGPENPRGNAFTRSVTRLTTEGGAQRVAAAHKARVWAIISTERLNRMGRPTSYVLYPEGQPTLLADKASSIYRRAQFATKHLWVSQYRAEELWSAGPVVNQHPGGGGLPGYVSGDRDIDGRDIVLWHTFGLTHFPRLEDWPIMPVDYAGFTLKPHGFFDRNPTLDVPSTADSHCAHHGPRDCSCG